MLFCVRIPVFQTTYLIAIGGSLGDLRFIDTVAHHRVDVLVGKVSPYLFVFKL